MTTSRGDGGVLDIATVARGLVDQLSVSGQAMRGDAWRVRRGAWELLSRGNAVTEGDVASATGVAPDVVDDVLSRDVERDEAGRITGVSGLTLVPTQHRIWLGYSDLYTWCALDLLLFPRLLHRAAEFESECPATGGRITGLVTADGPGELEPKEGVLSLVVPPSGAPIRSSFCNFVQFFRSAQVAQAWVMNNPDGYLLDAAQTFELANQLTRSIDLEKEQR